MDRSKINQGLAVACTLIGVEMSEGQREALVTALAGYPEEWVLGALERCSAELRYKISLADILERLADGRLGAEEAWAMMPKSEVQTVVWTEEMAEAWGAALPLISEGELVQARMAFLESYRTKVSEARRTGRMPRWTPSLGSDRGAREAPIMEAVRLGRMGKEQALTLLPFEAHEDVLRLIQSDRPIKRLGGA